MVCGRLGFDLCAECINKLELSEEQICPMCGEGSVSGATHEGCKKKLGMDGLVSVYDYQDPAVVSIIGEIKYGFNSRLAEQLVKNMKFNIGLKFDLIVPVPLYFYRENWRGFNQAEVIARGLSVSMGVPFESSLMRIKNTKQQAVLERSVRLKNMKGAFVLKKALAVKRVVLVDDVFTSGASMRECVEVLKRGGVDEVWGFSLAH